MPNAQNSDPEAVGLATLSWKAAADSLNHLRTVPTTAMRLAWLVSEPDMHADKNNIEYDSGAAVINKNFFHLGVPLRNQTNELEVEWGDSPFVLTLRETDSFGEVLIELSPSEGKATAYSVVIDRTMKGGVSFPSPCPEEQMVTRIGRFSFDPIGEGMHRLSLKAVEERVSFAVDGKEILSFEDPDVAGGCFGIGTWETVRLRSFKQTELITNEEAERREDFVREMGAFCAELDAERDADIAARNELSVGVESLDWRYPETGATLSLDASGSILTGQMHAGLYGNARMLTGIFAYPEVTDNDGKVFQPSSDAKPRFEGDQLHFRITIPLRCESGEQGTISLLAKFTENALWFCTAEVEGIEVKSAALAFGMDPEFELNWSAAGVAGKPAALAYGTATLVTSRTEIDPSRTGFGLGQSDGKGLTESLLCTDSVAGHVWKSLSGHDTKMEIAAVGGAPAVVVRSEQAKFRWALMWMPYHRLNLTGYKKRMVHFIRHPEEPYSNFRERPSKFEYPTDEELERYARNGTKAMVWHHTWTGNNSRRREGFVVNEKEMARAMKRAHELGIAVIPYIGIVPGRHPVLRYEDLTTRMFYDKNWDLQDFSFYSVAGRFSEFFPYMTDYWCREYGIDGFYTDGGLAGLDWGYTGLSEDDFDGMSLEELNDRLYYRVRKVLSRHNVGFGLENWGGSPIHLPGPWYDCRMIGEAFHEASPDKYRDGYNPLLTSTPFKMYAANLQSRNRYNVAMAAVCMTDLQLCSGNYAWGCWPDAPSDWKNLLPFWSVLDGIAWDNLVDARPWWAQKLVKGEGFYAGSYITTERAVFFVANHTEDKTPAAVAIQLDELPERLRTGRMRAIYPESGDWRDLGDGTFEVDLPRLHDGPLGFEIIPRD